MRNRKDFGNYGEKMAEMFLMKHNFEVIQRNYRNFKGEIDIIAEKQGIIHFIEVKTVSRETFNRGIKPEDHVTREKLTTIELVAEQYMTLHGIFDTPAQIDVICIISERNKDKTNENDSVLHVKPHIYMIENVTRENY